MDYLLLHILVYSDPDGLDFFFTVPAYYALILRSLTVLEGLALNADPNFKVLAASYPYFAKRLLTDPNPYLRDALIELLFKDGKFRYAFCCYLKFVLGAVEYVSISTLEYPLIWSNAGGVDLKTCWFKGERTEISLLKRLCNLS